MKEAKQFSETKLTTEPTESSYKRCYQNTIWLKIQREFLFVITGTFTTI